MSIVKIQGNASGTGEFTLASPNGNTNRTITLPDATGTLDRTNRAGNVLQVVSATKTDVFTTTNTSWVDVTGLSVTITPTSATSKILVMANIQMDNASVNQRFFFRFVRNSTAICVGDAVGSRSQATNTSQSATGGGVCTPFNSSFLDSPATTSSTTYKIQTAALDVGTIVVNRSSGDSDTSSYARSASTITIMEIAA